MTSLATVTSKGQVTLPVAVRRALAIEAGDRLVFTVSEDRITVEKSPDFVALAGSVPVPPDRRGADWSDALAHTRRERAQA